MKPSSLRLFLVLLGLMGPAGCTQLTVTKVSPDDTVTPGIRYSLPKLVLKVTPAADGSITTDEVYLPDALETFAVDARTVMATHALNIQTDRGMLKRVEWNPDSSAVLSEAATAGTKFAEEQFKARAEQEKTEATSIATARKALADAELAVQRASIKVDTLDRLAGPDNPKTIDAIVELKQAIASRDAARAALAQLLDQQVQRTGGGGSSSSASIATGGGTSKTVRGPIMYVLEDHGTPMAPALKLTAVGVYKVASTGLFAPDPQHPHQPSYLEVRGEPAQSALKLELFPRAPARGQVLIAADKDGKRERKFVPSVALAKIESASLRPVNANNEPTGGALAFGSLWLENELAIAADFGAVTPGTYKLSIVAAPAGPNAEPLEGVTFLQIK